MTTVRLSVSLIAMLVLSGCGSMMYGSNTAPVVDQNQYLNQYAGKYPPASQVLPPVTTAVPPSPNPYQPQSALPQPPRVSDQPKVANTVPKTSQTPPTASDQPKYEPVPPVSNPNTNHGNLPPQASDQPKYAQNTPNTNVNQPRSASDTPKYDTGKPQADGWNVEPNTSNTISRTPTPPPPVKVNRNEPVPSTPSETAPPVASDTPKVEPKPEPTPQPKTEPKTEPKSENTQVAANTTAERPTTGSGAAVSDLLSKASSALGKGDLNGAASHLEAAQRIDSKNPKILYDIANIRYHQGRYREAETFAGRAANLGGENSMSKKSWQLISNARKALGDNQGAVQAAERAARFN